jgi:hypothetical protein
MFPIQAANIGLGANADEAGGVPDWYDAAGNTLSLVQILNFPKLLYLNYAM